MYLHRQFCCCNSITYNKEPTEKTSVFSDSSFPEPHCIFLDVSTCTREVLALMRKGLCFTVICGFLRIPQEAEAALLVFYLFSAKSGHLRDRQTSA